MALTFQRKLELAGDLSKLQPLLQRLHIVEKPKKRHRVRIVIFVSSTIAAGAVVAVVVCRRRGNCCGAVAGNGGTHRPAPRRRTPPTPSLKGRARRPTPTNRKTSGPPGPHEEGGTNVCRWLAYSGSPVLLEDLLLKPQHSLIDQSLHSRLGATTTNGDGFGLGWYGVGDTPGVFHSIEPAWNERNLGPGGASRVAARVRAHPCLDRRRHPADQLPSVQARAVAVDAQRPDP